MSTTQVGDRVRVHYVKRTQAGTVFSSRGGTPLEVTVGDGHPRLPGLGEALVGLGEGERVTVLVPAELAYGSRRPDRVRRVGRAGFPTGEALTPGRWVRFTGRSGHRRPVRILEVSDRTVLVDANHPWAGQAVALEVEVVAIVAPGGEPGRP
jgi:peptidylprolyl isomerase